MVDILEGKRILIVDDEQDILETLEELLDMCLIDSAPDFNTACKFLDKYSYDAAVLDIMGVRGYELLQKTGELGIPAVMLTAHALNPDNLVKSIEMGAQCYVPKDKIGDIAFYLADVFKAREYGIQKHGNWFKRLKPFFDKKFGSGWRESHKEFWEVFDKNYHVKKEDIENIM
ncbi:MAG TPA: response regulator [Desulfobacteraceae bacterium]|nr:response regulator [Desulfobacteraceae bacterium]